MNVETGIQKKILVSLAGVSTLFRNNCGAFKKPNGAVIRYGIANPGGSDLIGWTPVLITPDMVGHTMPVFTAIEVKCPPFTKPKSKHEKRQDHFINVILRAGGLAGFATTPDEAKAILNI